MPHAVLAFSFTPYNIDFLYKNVSIQNRRPQVAGDSEGVTQQGSSFHKPRQTRVWRGSFFI